MIKEYEMWYEMEKMMIESIETPCERYSTFEKKLDSIEMY
jgi:hypothetical protein